ncbi:MAG TPA: hypothetical protein VHR66_32915 [Gemmataceae bacterium]|nr:hypothetical protein [Gemmataceae bacterium]
MTRVNILDPKLPDHLRAAFVADLRLAGLTFPACCRWPGWSECEDG